MTRSTTLALVASVLAAAALALPGTARADGGGGSRQVAGGGHMSSYVSDPYHDPRSLHSQRMGTGQLLGAPMFNDGPMRLDRPALARRGAVEPHWAAGWSRGRPAR